jgi:hypothetical protein
MPSLENHQEKAPEELISDSFPRPRFSFVLPLQAIDHKKVGKLAIALH